MLGNFDKGHVCMCGHKAYVIELSILPVNCSRKYNSFKKLSKVSFFQQVCSTPMSMTKSKRNCLSRPKIVYKCLLETERKQSLSFLRRKHCTVMATAYGSLERSAVPARGNGKDA